MGLVVIGADMNYKEEDIIQAAIGMDDENGQPFQIIHLDWNPAKKNTQYAKSQGFEDAVIERTEVGLTISYRRPGCAKWYAEGITKRYVARIPYTKHNMAVLGAGYMDGLWTIREAHFREAAAKIWERIQDALSPEQRGEDKKRREGHHIPMYERPEDHPNIEIQTKQEDKVSLSNLKADLVKRNSELNDKLEQIKKTEDWIKKHMAELAARGIALVHYDEKVLRRMKMPELRSVANKEFSIKVRPGMGKEELVTEIMKLQYGTKVGRPASGYEEAIEEAGGKMVPTELPDLDAQQEVVEEAAEEEQETTVTG